MSALEASNLFSIKGMVFVITGGGSGRVSVLDQASYSQMPQVSVQCSQTLWMSTARQRFTYSVVEWTSSRRLPRPQYGIHPIHYSPILISCIAGEQIHRPNSMRHHIQRISRSSSSPSRKGSRLRQRRSRKLRRHRTQPLRPP
jgi:hypothetical protein